MLGTKKYSPPFGTTNSSVRSSVPWAVKSGPVPGLVPIICSRLGGEPLGPSLGLPMMGSRPGSGAGGVDSLMPPGPLAGGKLFEFTHSVVGGLEVGLGWEWDEIEIEMGIDGEDVEREEAQLTLLDEFKSVPQVTLVAGEEQATLQLPFGRTLLRLCFCWRDFGTELDAAADDATGSRAAEVFEIVSWVGLAQVRCERAAVLALGVEAEDLVLVGCGERWVVFERGGVDGGAWTMC